VNPRRLGSLREKLAVPPPKCAECLHRFHCSMGCPDFCPLTDPSPADGRFDYRIAHALGLAVLIETAGCRVSGKNLEEPGKFFGDFKIVRRMS
jgi:hypothetical protein